MDRRAEHGIARAQNGARRTEASRYCPAGVLAGACRGFSGSYAAQAAAWDRLRFYRRSSPPPIRVSRARRAASSNDNPGGPRDDPAPPCGKNVQTFATGGASPIQPERLRRGSNKRARPPVGEATDWRAPRISTHIALLMCPGYALERHLASTRIVRSTPGRRKLWVIPLVNHNLRLSPSRWLPICLSTPAFGSSATMGVDL